MLSATGKPPAELRLFRAGINKTLKGDFVWSARSVAAVEEQWARLGRDFGFDVEHSTFDPAVAPKDREAAGWGQIDPRPEGLFVRAIKWTPDMAAKIAARAFRYISPTPQIDRATGEIVGVLNAALTNLPATLNAAPLVLSARSHLPPTRTTMDPKMLIKDMYTACSALLASCQSGAESEDPAVKEMCSALSEVLAPTCSKLQEMGATADGEPAPLATLSSVFEAAQQVTGAKEGLVGALLALSARAAQKDAAQKGAAQDERADLWGKIVAAKKAVPADRDRFLKLSAADLRSYLAVAPALVPVAEVAVPAVQLSASPAAPAAEDAEVDALLGLVRVG